MTNIKRSDKVAQHNALINARFSMVPLQMRLFVNLLAQLSFEDEDFKPLFVSTAHLIEGRGGSSYEALDQMCTDIASFVATIEVLEEGTRRRSKKPIRRNIPLMAEATYRADLNGVIAKFNPLIKPYLLQLKESGNFTTADLHEVLKLKSPYALRIYWLLKEYGAFGRRTISLADLRYTLGIEDDQYSKLANLRARVLDDAQKQLSVTDIPFTYDFHKQGRKVTEVAFKFPSNSARQLGHPVYELNTEWAPGLSSLGLSDHSIVLIAQQLEKKEYDLDYINYVVKRTGENVRLGRVKNGAGQIHDALQQKYWLDDYRRVKTSAKPTTKVLLPAAREEIAYRLSEVREIYDHPGPFANRSPRAPTFEEHLQQVYLRDGFSVVERKGQQWLVKPKS